MGSLDANIDRRLECWLLIRDPHHERKEGEAGLGKLQFKDDKFLVNLVGSPGVSIARQNNPYLSVTGCELPGKAVTSSQAALRS